MQNIIAKTKMKKILTLIFFITPIFCWSQQTFTSSYTQHWPTIFTSEIEQINRSIAFEENAISLVSENKSGKEIETFYIRKINERENAIFYTCLNSLNQQVTIVKPNTALRFIDIYRLSSKSGEEEQIRLHLN